MSYLSEARPAGKADTILIGYHPVSHLDKRGQILKRKKETGLLLKAENFMLYKCL